MDLPGESRGILRPPFPLGASKLFAGSLEILFEELLLKRLEKCRRRFLRVLSQGVEFETQALGMLCGSFFELGIPSAHKNFESLHFRRTFIEAREKHARHMFKRGV